jgi:uncharacterized phage-associated protein
MVSAITIANQFIERARRDGVALTNMQLQKLVYIAHAWALALDQGLIYEPVEAWLWGPVIPSLFHNLGRYGDGEVTSPIPISGVGKIGAFDGALLESVWKSYGRMSGFTLSKITHNENTPWSRTVKDFGLRSVIPESYMRDHYRRLYDEQIRRKREHGDPQPVG